MPEPNRDRWGRYLLPHPETGVEQGWTRVTTLAKALDDETNLAKWKMRNVAFGMGQRPDLLALAQSHTLEEDKQTFNKIAQSAMDAAQSDVRSNLGTALHKMAERIDRGEKFRVPPLYADDIAAYLAVKEKFRVLTHPSFIERITVVPELEVAGTFDRLGMQDQVVRVVDLKTGRDVLEYGQLAIAIQLAIYSRGRVIWNMDTSQWEPAPAIDQDRGIVLHVPAGEARAEAYWVDLQEGWKAAQFCYQVREVRKAKGLLTPIAVTEPAA